MNEDFKGRSFDFKTIWMLALVFAFLMAVSSFSCGGGVALVVWAFRSL